MGRMVRWQRTFEDDDRVCYAVTGALGVEPLDLHRTTGEVLSGELTANTALAAARLRKGYQETGAWPGGGIHQA